MNAPACMVITAEQWAEICNAFVVFAAMTVALSVRWGCWYDRIEWRWIRYRRRQRLAAIRAARA